MKRLALLTSLAVLAVPAAAHAYAPADLARYNAVADQAWGGACAGRLHPVVVEHLPGDTSDPQVVTLGQAAINDATTCTYWIVAGLDSYDACLVVVHEAAHLAGYRSPNPAINPDGSVDWAHDRGATIMNPLPIRALPDGAYEPCAQAAPPVLTIDAAANWVQARWEMDSLDCRRSEIPSRQRCWGHTVNDTRVVFVVWRGEGYRVQGARLGRRGA